MNNKQKYDQAFIESFSISESALDDNLIYIQFQNGILSGIWVWLQN